MGSEFNITKDTQTALLLCAKLSGKSNEKPLTIPQFEAFNSAILAEGKKLSDLLDDESLIESAVFKALNENKRLSPFTKENVLNLLHRSFALSSSLNKWAGYGIKVVGRNDAKYPKRMKKYLDKKAPPFLFYAGNESLFRGGGMAFVGSRDIGDIPIKAIGKVVKECVEHDMNIVSGGARGADLTSMEEAYRNGGRVIGALSCDLCKAVISPVHRDALSDGRALFFSAAGPEESFSVSAAMERNKYIYSMADCSFVAQSDIKGGTWSGATEELKRSNHNPLFVYAWDNMPEGNLMLIGMGGIPWEDDAEFVNMVRPSDTVQKREQSKIDQFFNC